ncbi:RNA polymerase sigma factor [Asticcacaulis sp. BE141]|uniref:RNA polymerase sigma factor n=1 Tax=Asticcacaulis sp. BE141 TaxID=2817848 RepID=UPI002862ADB6|nr:RNA polymerase sigma factor [Asticcacaulis sp. BE141]MBP2161766.1 RNA polymerase sigma-70 factor (ECF subfamily) [Asticcacaulis solisilvae]MDR6802812.1 RNA polymerase sigma-70 factor (ECF subfamily) [Asticcacaulis sp. BE141]
MAADDDFADWIAPHVGRLTRISRAFAAPADRHDLMQELLIAVWKARPAFRGDASPATFIYRVAHNRALTWRRREGLRWLKFARFRDDLMNLPPESGEDPRLETLYAAIRELPPVDRSLMLLALDGVSYADMSALHALSESNIGARLTRARARLMAIIGETSDGF